MLLEPVADAWPIYLASIPVRKLGNFGLDPEELSNPSYRLWFIDLDDKQLILRASLLEEPYHLAIVTLVVGNVLLIEAMRIISPKNPVVLVS